MSELSYEKLKQLFQFNGDIIFQYVLHEESPLHIISCEAMIDEKMLYDVVVPAITNYKGDWSSFIQQRLLPQLQQIMTPQEAEVAVFNGQCLVVTSEVVFSVNIANKPNRQPEETSLEVLVKGPRDNFIEQLATNVALIRKRLPTKTLAVKKYSIGARSKTAVALLYFQDVVDAKIVAQIERQMKAIDTDVVFSGELLMEMINKKAYLFPRYEYTGRPDFAVQSLARGRVIILVEGSAYGMITPVSFFVLLKAGEDNEYPSFYSSFQRLLRFLGLILGLLLPAFWLALTTFHQNQIPLQLLATVVQGNTGLPLPSALEMLLMLLFFELFREAGLRLPSVIGGTISVVGGLIIGDAAIRAGVTSPAMVVVIAISTIASFTLVNQAIVATVSVLRIIFIFITAMLGLFGFFFCIYFTLMYMATIKVFGVPYLNVGAELSLKNMAKTFLRLRHRSYKVRPESLKPKDKTRGSNDR